MEKLYTKGPSGPAVQAFECYDRLRALVVAGTFDMGERLGEDRLAALLGTSRTPVRAALSRLEAEGYLTYAPNRGHRMRVYTVDDVRDIYACRAILESEAVLALTLQRPDPELTASWQALIDEMDQCLRCGEPETLIRSRYLPLNHRFHAALYEACPNVHLRGLISQQTELPLVIRNYFNFSGEQFLESHLAHKQILAAIVNGEARRAASLMREHIWAARDRMLEPGMLARVERPRRRAEPAPSAAASPRNAAASPPSTGASALGTGADPLSTGTYFPSTEANPLSTR